MSARVSEKVSAKVSARVGNGGAGSRGPISHRLIGRALRLPTGPTPYVVHAGIDVAMRDGVRLKADHYAPTDGSNKGTVLVRGPYSRVGLPAIIYARPFVTHGYHVVMQNSRGTFGSGGEAFRPAVAEPDDARDTVTWLREQPWYTGRFATFGGSYLGFAQWAQMRDAPEDLAAAVVLVGPDDLSRLAWRGGAFRLADLLTWSESLAWQEEVGTVRGIVRGLRERKRHAPVAEDLAPLSASQQLLKGRSPWLAEWARHPDPTDDFWSAHQATEALDDLTVPVLLAAGWQDVILQQNLQQWAALRQGPSEVALTVGPWKHGPDLVFKAAGPLMSEALDWVDTHLGDATSTTRDAPVHVQLRGDKSWRSLPDWPPAAEPLTLFLAGDGALSHEPLQAGRLGGDQATTAFTYDPTRPTPAMGGAQLSVGAGYRDCQHIDVRDDVATFTGPVLTEPLVIAGTAAVELAHSCDTQAHDVYVRLSEVDGKGRSIHVCDAFVRLDEARSPADTLRLELDTTAYRFAAGSRVRLVVAGGSHPVYARRLGPDGAVLGGAHLQPQTHTITHDATRPSLLVLPTVDWT